jgi:hypothetical integral membrane protein (TIGR02206 family)
VPLFGLLHLTLIAAIAAVSILASLLVRAKRLPARATCLAIGWGLVINELIWWTFRYSREGLHATNLPLQLCDVSLWLSALACITRARRMVEFAYFVGIAGAGMAVLTPNLYWPWPSYPAIYFFVAHGGIVIAVSVLVFGRVVALEPGAVWRAFAVLLAFAAAIGAVDKLAGADYMFLCEKPKGASLLDSLGPWPWYLVGGAALALALFWLLWLPVRPTRPSASPASRSSASP